MTIMTLFLCVVDIVTRTEYCIYFRTCFFLIAVNYLNYPGTGCKGMIFLSNVTSFIMRKRRMTPRISNIKYRVPNVAMWSRYLKTSCNKGCSRLCQNRLFSLYIVLLAKRRVLTTLLLSANAKIT